MRGIAFLAVAGMYGVTLVGVASQQADTALPAGEGKALIETNCTKCHELSKVIHARQTKISWQQTVENMVGRGAQVSDDDVPVIVEYLAANFGQINVNTASQSQLQSFLGFSDAECEAIVAYRKENGKIKNFEQLAKVPGLDPAKIEAKHDLIAFAQ